MNESVVITGIGVVNAAGLGLPAFENSLRHSATGLRMSELRRETGSVHLLLGSVKDEDLPSCIEPRRHLNFKHMSRSGTMVCAAAGLATKDARFSPSEHLLQRTGIVMGTAFGGMQSMLKFNADVRTKGPNAVNPIIFPDTVSNAPAGYAAIAFGMMGMNATLSTGFSSGIRAIRVAYEQVASGNLEAALAGGYDELIPDLCHYWQISGSLSPAYPDGDMISAPFDSQRNGFHPGEGAVVMVLERRSTAEDRGAPIYGELAGFGSCQSNHNTASPVEMKRSTMERALKEASLDFSDIAAVFASANGSVDGDREEADAIRATFGPEAIVSAVKAYTGECMAGAGPAAVAAALFALRERSVPGIPGLNHSGKHTPLRVSKCPTPMGDRNACLINAFGPDAQGESVVVSAIQ